MRPLPALGLAALAELVVFVLVAEWVGAGWATVGVVLLSTGGWFLLRASGRASAARLTELSRQGGGLRVDDGAMAVRWAAGLLLLVPGYLSAVAGLVLLLPPVSRWSQRRTSQRLLGRVAAFSPPGTTIPGYVVRQDRPEPGQPPALDPPA